MVEIKNFLLINYASFIEINEYDLERENF